MGPSGWPAGSGGTSLGFTGFEADERLAAVVATRSWAEAAPAQSDAWGALGCGLPRQLAQWPGPSWAEHSGMGGLLGAAGGGDSGPSSNCCGSAEALTKSKSRKQRRQRLRMAMRLAGSQCLQPSALCVALEMPAPEPTVFAAAAAPPQRPPRDCHVGSSAAALATGTEQPGGRGSSLGRAAGAARAARAASAPLPLHSLQGHVVELALDSCGCRALQKALEVLPREQQEQLASELRSHTVRCAEHQHGNFVLQKLVEELPPAALGFMADDICGRAQHLAMNEYGCRVIQRLLEYWPHSQLEHALDELTLHIRALSFSKFGNHVVQRVLQRGRRSDQQRVIAVIQSDIVGFSTDRFASRVVELCIDILHTSDHALHLATERAALLRALIGDHGDVEQSPILRLVDHPYGNYVVQQAIRCCKGLSHRRLFDVLRSRSSAQGQRQISRHVTAALVKQLAQDVPAGKVPVPELPQPTAPTQ